MHEDAVGIPLQSSIKMTEEDGKIVLDITDHTGGLGYKLFIDTVVASRMAQRMLDLSRFIVSKTVEDPLRTEVHEFVAGVAD